MPKPESTELQRSMPLEVMEVGDGTPSGPPQHWEPSVGHILMAAVEHGLPAEQLEKLVALHQSMEDREAAKRYATALAEFQLRCPAIAKTATAQILDKQGGVKFSFDYAKLEAIVAAAGPHLHDCGFSYRWDTKISDGILFTTCILTHKDGHSDTATFPVPIESATPMSPQHKQGAAFAYGRNKSLQAVTGIVTEDPDEKDLQPMTDDQRAEIKRLFALHPFDESRLLTFVGASSLDTIPRGGYQSAVNYLVSILRKQNIDPQGDR